MRHTRLREIYSPSAGNPVCQVPGVPFAFVGDLVQPVSRSDRQAGLRPPGTHLVAFILALLALGITRVKGAELRPQALDAFTQYARSTEARIQGELNRPGGFLYVDGLPATQRTQVLAILRRGDIYMERLKTRDANGRVLGAPDAIIHHWLGAVFIPCVTLQQTLDLVKDYDHHQDIYKPEVVRSRLISHNGNDFKIYYRFRKKKIITVTLNTEHEVCYFPVDATHCWSRSYSTRIAEVTDADSPREGEKPLGRDGGFLWQLFSYWRFEERDGGVFVECESISLTRDVPTLLKPLINPFITGIPKESLQMTMGSTRSALLGRHPCKAKNADIAGGRL